jgi:hypothetical protein
MEVFKEIIEDKNVRPADRLHAVEINVSDK